MLGRYGYAGFEMVREMALIDLCERFFKFVLIPRLRFS